MEIAGNKGRRRRAGCKGNSRPKRIGEPEGSGNVDSTFFLFEQTRQGPQVRPEEKRRSGKMARGELFGGKSTANVGGQGRRKEFADRRRRPRPRARLGVFHEQSVPRANKKKGGISRQCLRSEEQKNIKGGPAGHATTERIRARSKMRLLSGRGRGDHESGRNRKMWKRGFRRSRTLLQAVPTRERGGTPMAFTGRPPAVQHARDARVETGNHGARRTSAACRGGKEREASSLAASPEAKGTGTGTHQHEGGRQSRTALRA